MTLRIIERNDNSLWIPVAGLTLIGAGLRRRTLSGGVLVAGGAYLMVRSLEISAGRTALQRLLSEGLTVYRTLAIDAPREYVYQFWKQFNRFPEFMQHLIKVEPTEDGQWQWTARGPLGMTFSWTARALANEENRRIAWESVAGSEIENHGSVEFSDAPGRRGTFVKVELFYRPPAGKIGKAFASIFGEDPEQQVREDLRRVKQLIEAGEIPTTEGQPAGRRSALVTAIKALHGEGRQRAGTTMRSAS